MDFYSGDGFAFSHTPIISTFALHRQTGKFYGDQAMDKVKIMRKVAYLIIATQSVLFFCLWRCLLSIPPSYIEDARNEGVTILSALRDAQCAGTALYFGIIIVAVVMHVEIFPRHPISASSRNNRNNVSTHSRLAARKSRAFNRALSIMLVSGITFVCAVLTRMPSL